MRTSILAFVGLLVGCDVAEDNSFSTTGAEEYGAAFAPMGADDSEAAWGGDADFEGTFVERLSDSLAAEDGVWADADGFRAEGHNFEAVASGSNFMVTKSMPEEGAEAARDASVVITFNKKVNIETVFIGAEGVMLYDDAGGTVDGVVSSEDNVIIFSPTEALAPDTDYELTIGGEVYAASGAVLAEDYSLQFYTGTALPGFGGGFDPGDGGDPVDPDEPEDETGDDSSAPDIDPDDRFEAGPSDDDSGSDDDLSGALDVESAYPAHGAMVAPSGDLTMTFSEDIDPESLYIGEHGVRVIDSEGIEVKGELWVAGDTVGFTPYWETMSEQGYKFQVGTDVLSIDGANLEVSASIGFDLVTP